MLVFVTHPKFFDKKFLYRKNVDLVYIFNSKKLFNELSEKYKCVNIGSSGKIKDENFFPAPVKYKPVTKEKFLDLKIGIYAYFKKKRHKMMRRHYVMLRGWRDNEFEILKSFAKKALKNRKENEAFAMVDNAIQRSVVDILELERGKEYVEEFSKFIIYLNNYAHSFYRSYIYSLGFKRGEEIFGDVFRYSYFDKVMLYYRFWKRDIYNGKFHFNYLKVLSRVFIEDIHKNNIKNYIVKNIKYYKENEWL